MHNLRGRALGGWALTLLLGASLLVFSGQLVTAAQAAELFKLQGPERSREGYFQLEVDGLDDDQAFVIELSTSEDFSSIDATFSPLGSFRQLSLSGFDDGTYYFRARLGSNGEVDKRVETEHDELADESSEQGEEDTYSNVVRVDVEHYPLWQALGLFALGALLFIALITVLLRLHWRSRSGG